ncbi:hypothetical protein B0T24DRAFT_539902 [Lasiosphaeria ovina]|uniref:Uncharacterized protein n=1 Tax=Lasiosphaeria ovina TaxID=92902 RepID=A0AAE0JSH3_9PEZI|nr:hypothetical protein B0T24DRAFT_539902 [Lasiosphaeria ovina]
MGAYVSINECYNHYNKTVDCTYNFTSPDRDNHTVSGFGRHEVPTDPDVAGVGIVYTFIGVTSFALALSILHVAWMISKMIGWKSRFPPSESEYRKSQRGGGLSIAVIFETLVMTCSDQQVFTGGAYALTLRYWKGCEITAYHYNIISNMMILTCATHLMSVTIVRNYWRYPWLAILRILIVTGLFIVTGIFLSSQNEQTTYVGLPFPSAIPPGNQIANIMFLPAACFQSNNSLLMSTLLNSTSSPEQSKQSLIYSQPGNRIQGWNLFLFILFCYCAAFIVDVVRFFRRGIGKEPRGWRGNFAAKHPRFCTAPGRVLKVAVQILFCLYLLGGIAVSAAAVILSAKYINDLRTWAKSTGWLEVDEGGQSAEDDATSFGQLVPIFLCLLIVFSIAQTLSGELSPYPVLCVPPSSR